ncbi:4'-phosphopantetheinyl transferase superfamily protein [Streptomyces sp. NPDC048606]|uniref:4'-phosphopantetheinyl transferase family protein n=1 Tax=Streptomyces sp. NPDC048606 TaxID=3154726 RepID=UPI00341ECAEB
MQSSLERAFPPPGWTPAPWPRTRPGPAEGAVDLWLLRVPDAGAASVTLDRTPLDAEERARAAGFARPVDGYRYAAAHLALRRVLSAYRGVGPGELGFVREPCPGCGAPHGRPALAGATGPHFSLSHTGGMVLIAVAGRPVGADVEGLPAPDRVAGVVEALHPAERAAVGAAPPALRPAVFARLWARKEAYLKGLGTGLGRGPDLDYLGDPGPGAPPRPSGWTVRDVTAGPGHAAALALAHPPGAPDLTVGTFFLGTLDDTTARTLSDR